MAEPIYKMYAMKPTETWHQLSQQEQQALLSRLQQKQAELGIKIVVLCDSSWASEQYPLFGLETYPDFAAVRAYSAFLNEINWLRYNESLTLLGTPLPTA